MQVTVTVAFSPSILALGVLNGDTSLPGNPPNGDLGHALHQGIGSGCGWVRC